MTTENYIPQWDLPRGAKVKLSDGQILTFNKMDGMYAQWITQWGTTAIGNFDGFEIVDGFYRPINIPE